MRSNHSGWCLFSEKHKISLKLSLTFNDFMSMSMQLSCLAMVFWDAVILPRFSLRWQCNFLLTLSSLFTQHGWLGELVYLTREHSDWMILLHHAITFHWFQPNMFIYISCAPCIYDLFIPFPSPIFVEEYQNRIVGFCNLKSSMK